MSYSSVPTRSWASGCMIVIGRVNCVKSVVVDIATRRSPYTGRTNSW